MMRKTIIALTILLCLTGCSSEEPVTNVCQSNSGKEVTLVSLGNEIQTMIEEDVYTFEDLGVKKTFMEDQTNQDKLLNDYKDLYANVTKGLNITMEVTETGVIFTISVDFTQADFNELKTLGIIANADIDYVGLEETISQMQLNCVIQD